MEEHDIGESENIIKIQINHDLYMHGFGVWSIYDDVTLTTSANVESLNNYDNLLTMPKSSMS